MDDKFLSYSQHSTNRDYSNFDGTIQNLYTSKFGELCPVFCKPVLAGDSFKIALNSEVKVSTLAAPTYSNIKQNFYSLFTPIQSFWSHWNDFITNGSEFQNVYGSNLTNQDLKNPWKIPSVLTNHLQPITKLAKGFAIPIISVYPNFSNVLNAFKVLPISDNSSNGITLNSGHTSFVIHLNISTAGLYRPSGSETYGVSHDCDDSVLCNLLSCFFSSWRSFMMFVPYVHFYNLKVTQGSENSAHLTFTFDSVDFGLSLDDFNNFYLSMTGSDFTNVHSMVDTFNYNSSPLVQQIKFRTFCNEFSQSLDVNNSPFGFKSFVFSDVFDGISLNATRMYRKIVNPKELNDSVFVSNTLPAIGSSFKLVNSKFVQLSDFWSKEIVIGKLGDSTDTIFVRVNDDVILRFNAEDSLGTDYLALFEDDLYYPTLSEHSYCNSSNLTSITDNNNTCIDNSVSNTSPWLHVSNPNHDEEESTLNHFGINIAACDFLFPFYVNSAESVLSSQFHYSIFDWKTEDSPRQVISYLPFIDSSAISNGMTTYTFMLYLCNSVCRMLDFNGIPFEGFTVRDYLNYTGECINMLPFMAQSKIWDEYFRNRTVSSPELDYCQVNGLGLYLYNNYKTISLYGKPESVYIPDDETYQNSWCIPFDVLPKNGVGTFNLNTLIQDSDCPVAIQGFNEFHYFNVTCFADLFALLTGFQLNHCVMHQVIKPYISVFDNEYEKYLDVLYGAIVDRFFLPSYYNGLLHFKYQNFNKDYFSSALLDAMSGANQEEIPDNVTELRQAEARQSFWEQTAVARSVKKFFNKMFGTTPTHLEKDRPLLLGQSHNRISIGEIIQTSGTAETPQGTRTGIGGSHAVSSICKHSFNEQGYLIILSSITLDSQYYQGLQKFLTPYDSYLDYPFPQFYHIGNQSINMRELSYFSNPRFRSRSNPYIFGKNLIYSDGSTLVPSRYTTIANNPIKVTQKNYDFDTNPNYCINSDTKFDGVFGYVPRFTEWKFNFDELHGDFRNTLMPWNTFRTFHTIPFLSHNFVNWELSGFNYDLNRLFAVTDDSDKFICSLYINVEMHRPIPYYTIPKSSVN